jgi:tripartite-type tricarboxylate transporter receptor subunit TctC
VLNHGGTVKGIAMMTKERSKVLPDVPTGIEQGVPNLEAYTWNAIFLSKEASAEMVNKLNRATVEAMESPNVSERLEGLGAVIVPPVRATPEYPAHCAQRDREMDGADQGKQRWGFMATIT